jgi:hypothetical protein
MPAPPRPGRLIRCRNTQSSCTNPPVWRPCTSTWQIPPRASPGARARAWARNIHAGKASKSPKGPLPQKSRETRASLQCQATSAGTTNTPRFRQSSTALDMPGQLSGALSSVHPICKKWVAAIRLSEIFGRSPQHRDAIFRQRYPLCCLLCWLSLSLPFASMRSSRSWVHRPGFWPADGVVSPAELFPRRRHPSSGCNPDWQKPVWNGRIGDGNGKNRRGGENRQLECAGQRAIVLFHRPGECCHRKCVKGPRVVPVTTGT